MSRYDAIPDALVTADLGEGVGVQPVVDWSVSRQMSGGGLPGQARGASGSSVGSGSVTAHSPAGRSPWTTGPIRPGGTVALDARADTAAPMSPVARMVVRDVSGSATSPALSVTIEDDIERLRAPSALSPLIATYYGVEGASVIDGIARPAGYRSTPAPTPGTILSVPLVGSTAPEVGGVAGLGPAPVWVEIDGHAALRGSGLAADAATVDAMAARPVSTLTVDHDGVGHIEAWLPPLGGVVRIYRDRVDVDTSSGVSSIGLIGAPAAGPWRRVQVQVDRSSLSAVIVSARVNGGAWSQASAPLVSTSPDGMTVAVDGAAMRGLIWTGRAATLDDASLLARPTSRIGLSGVTYTAVLVDAPRSAWEMLQEIARATLGWVGIDADGTLVYRGRDALRGGVPTEAIIAEESLEDVPWTISADDVADRVEVTYRPPVILTATGSAGPTHTMWESTEPISIMAGQHIVTEAQIQGAIGRLASSWLPVWDATYPVSEWSRWNAFLGLDGSDTTQPPDDALAIDAQMLSSDRVRIAITNRTPGPLRVTQLTLRAYTAARAGEALTVSRGTSADTARSVLTYDLGTWVQDSATAREILDWLAGTTSEPLPTLTGVRVVPDVSRRLGQIVKVTDRTTALASKALITGISMSGSDGSLTQNLDLAILATTFNDVDTWLNREGLTTFDLLDARLTALGLTTFDKLDDYLTRLGGTL